MFNKSNTTIKCYEFYDQLEVLIAKNYLADFPVHFHETICITLVSKGFECTKVEDCEMINPIGGISFTHANEAHANPNLNEEDYSFTTYYINPEVIKHITHRQENYFIKRVVEDNYLYQELMYWHTLDSSEQNEKSFSTILSYIVQNYVSAIPLDHIDSATNKKLKEAIYFMNENWNKKIYLEDLAKITSQNKYAFLRSFRRAKGITPIKYLVIKRLEEAKRLLKMQYPIVDVSYKCGFFDQSHFANYFKQYVGLTPLQYQLGCNILQE